MKLKKASIKWKIFMYLLAFTVILLVILWLMQICYLDTFYKMIKTSEAKQLTSEVISVLQSGSDSDTIDSEIEQLAAENNMAILVTDVEGNICYNAEYIANSRLNTLPLEEIQRYYQQALAENGSTEIEFEGNINKTFAMDNPLFDGKDFGQKMDAMGTPDADFDNVDRTDSMLPEDAVVNHGEFMQNRGQEMVESVIYVNVVNADGVDYLLMVNTQLTPVGATVNTLRIELIWITIVMVLLSLGIALLISRQISKSFIKINESAKKMAKGDFTVKFEGDDYKEIAELSDTLNATAVELDKNEKFQRELIANVSHDLRTPLTMIIAYSEVMRDLPGENSPENVQVVIDEASRLTNLVNDMLDISKLQAGVMQMKMTEYNLTESIHSVFERYNKLKEQDGYIINFEYDGKVMIEADEYKIFQVIYNLVNNAVNYTGANKTVTVKQIVKDNKVRIEVTDSGEGIEKEALAYVWDRYYKVDKTHKRAVMGTGLGLSIVKNILELHHAAYGVESEVGSGSTFWFELDVKKVLTDKE